MIKNNRLGILFIGIYQIISAVVLLLTLNVPQIPEFRMKFGLEFLPELVVRIIVGIVSIIVAYGYLKKFKWGALGMIIQSGYFLLICVIQVMKISIWKPTIGSMIYHGIIIAYTILNFREFGISRNQSKIKNIKN